MAIKNGLMVLLAVALFGSQVPSASAQALPELKAKNDPPPYVKLRDAAQVAAPRIVVGLVLDSQAVGLSPKMIAQLPKAWTGESVCARLLSPDALFEAIAEYNVDGSVAGKTAALALAFNADDLKIIQEREMDQLALTVSRGSCESSSEEFAISMTTQREKNSAESLVVFVNSQSAARVTVEVAGTGQTSGTIRCERSSAPSSVGFDHLCSLPVELFPTGENIELRINRRDRFGGVEPPTRVIVSTIGPPN